MSGVGTGKQAGTSLKDLYKLVYRVFDWFSLPHREGNSMGGSPMGGSPLFDVCLNLVHYHIRVVFSYPCFHEPWRGYGALIRLTGTWVMLDQLTCPLPDSFSECCLFWEWLSWTSVIIETRVDGQESVRHQRKPVWLPFMDFKTPNAGFKWAAELLRLSCVWKWIRSREQNSDCTTFWA